ncbi:hypothetical protein MRX96_013934 [Rhipicephalus microplus]
MKDGFTFGDVAESITTPRVAWRQRERDTREEDHFQRAFRNNGSKNGSPKVKRIGYGSATTPPSDRPPSPRTDEHPSGDKLLPSLSSSNACPFAACLPPPASPRATPAEHQALRSPLPIRPLSFLLLYFLPVFRSPLGLLRCGLIFRLRSLSRSCYCSALNLPFKLRSSPS